ncbi:siderophore-interacting protein [Nocardioides zeae]|uniref:Siderophore-interacting protein n=1 Tax=Nocardioides imazamoxiresistens TaxID=3231893 RepID=A0ABU3Q2F3_9ACTN|nr:siderophore-interacting protein [Nocardioides zeae]MDT9595230.1 siderophore-interacting protein [Nocardioides zeae]
MSTRAQQYAATVVSRTELTPHLVRLVLAGPGLAEFRSTGTSDEWVGLVVPGQFQSRYYTVRSWTPPRDGADAELVLDVVVHEVGLVTEWALRDCVGETVTVTEPKGSLSLPDDAAWLLLVGDLTALPAIARTLEEVRTARPALPVRVWAEVPDDPALLASYLPRDVDVTWSAPPGEGESRLGEVVEQIAWPEGEGYFWMAGESAQMRAIRKHLMRVVGLPSTAYDVMGYWRGGGQRRQPRAVDPAPIYAAGKAAGKTDDQIWADYDAAREHEENR